MERGKHTFIYSTTHFGNWSAVMLNVVNGNKIQIVYYVLTDPAGRVLRPVLSNIKLCEGVLI